MATALYDKTIFGPVHSRRLGISLGVNLMPVDRKICSFECIYCECGYAQKGPLNGSRRPTREEVSDLLRKKLTEMKTQGQLPDVITFAGNGEPTLHPDFGVIIEDTLALRNEFCPKARVAVLSNASRLDDNKVVAALRKVDDNILKLDGGKEATCVMLDQPNYKYNIEKTVEQIAQFAKDENSNLAVQTMFARWTINGKEYDNSTEDEVAAWLEKIRQIAPPRIMIYTIDRDTPLKDMQKVPRERLDEIGQLVSKYVGSVSVSG